VDATANAGAEGQGVRNSYISRLSPAKGYILEMSLEGRIEEGEMAQSDMYGIGMQLKY
jgi:hypothetical protein